MADVVSTRTRSLRLVFLHDSLRVERVNLLDTALQPRYCELQFIERQVGRFPKCWRGATGHDPRRMTQGPVDRFSKAVRKTCVDPTRRMPFLLAFQGMAEGFSAPWGIGASLEIPGLYPRTPGADREWWRLKAHTLALAPMCPSQGQAEIASERGRERPVVKD